MKRIRQPCGLTGLSILLTAGIALATPSMAAGKSYWDCSSGSWTAVGRPIYPQPVKSCGSRLHIPASEEECRRVGGHWGPAGLFPAPICQVQTHDGGRVCGDNNECEGMCLADLTSAERYKLMRERRALVTLGHCSPYQPIFGCIAVVEKGLVRGVLCRD